MANKDEIGTDTIGRTAFSWRRRLLLATVGVGLLGLLAVAAMLKPSPLHCGTHQQLGLPPCTFLMLVGRPCPTCGMTTAWANLVRGRGIDACRANFSGMLLGMLAVAATPWLLGSAWRGTWLGISPSGVAAAWISTSLLLITLIEWCFRLIVG